MFCAHPSHFGMLYNCYQDKKSYEASNEEMLKRLVILALLKIISSYQWYIDSVRN